MLLKELNVNMCYFTSINNYNYQPKTVNVIQASTNTEHKTQNTEHETRNTIRYFHFVSKLTKQTTFCHLKF
jgi:hypothetical protein